MSWAAWAGDLIGHGGSGLRRRQQSLIPSRAQPRNAECTNSPGFQRPQVLTGTGRSHGWRARAARAASASCDRRRAHATRRSSSWRRPGDAERDRQQRVQIDGAVRHVVVDDVAREQVEQVQGVADPAEVAQRRAGDHAREQAARGADQVHDQRHREQAGTKVDLLGGELIVEKQRHEQVGEHQRAHGAPDSSLDRAARRDPPAARPSAPAGTRSSRWRHMTAPRQPNSSSAARAAGE